MAANISCAVVYVGPAELVVNAGRTNDKVVMAMSVARAVIAPMTLKDCSW